MTTTLSPAYKDIHLNADRVLDQTPGSLLTSKQIQYIALSLGFALHDTKLIERAENLGLCDGEMLTAARGAAALMAMNNIYYRGLHLIHDSELSAMPAGLRMQFMAQPGCEKLDFELMSLAVSAIHGCGMCLKSHSDSIKKMGMNTASIAHVLRIAAVFHALAHTHVMQDHH